MWGLVPSGIEVVVWMMNINCVGRYHVSIRLLTHVQLADETGHIVVFVVQRQHILGE